MSPKRLFSVFRLEMGQNVRRPIFWILMLALGLTAYGLSTGDMMITSGDSTVGGKKAWITSEFAVAQMMTMVFPLFYSFFIAVVAGMSVIHDDELKVGELLHATSLRPSEYVWGKFLAILASFVVVVFLHLLFAVYFNHEFPNVKSSEIRGDFLVGNYLRPTCVFVLPMLVFLAGTAFAVGGDDAQADFGFCFAGRSALGMRVFPLGMGAYVARPTHRPGSHACGPGGVSLVEADLAEDRPRRRFL